MSVEREAAIDALVVLERFLGQRISSQGARARMREAVKRALVPHVGAMPMERFERVLDEVVEAAVGSIDLTDETARTERLQAWGVL